MQLPHIIVFSLCLLGSMSVGRADEEIEAESCEDCHDGDHEDAPVVTYSTIERSVHEDTECVECHEDAELDEHEDGLELVDCGLCHEEEAEVYVKHGILKVGIDEDIPSCASCHGTHEILESTDEDSQVHPSNMADTCGKCHEDLEITQNHVFLAKHPVESYRASVHGQATAEGSEEAATCNDCHSTGGTAHRILPPGDPESTINHFVIPATCGQCHEEIRDEYWEGIHGQLTARGETDSPVCTHCHGEHQIFEHGDPRSSVSHSRVAEATCAPCHESATLNEKYGMPPGRLATFVDTYHGLKSRAGDTEVANCASCHGAHGILPHTDPRSSIYADNLQGTCGECHPGISIALAQEKIHETGWAPLREWPDFVAALYIAVITLTVAGMLGYIFLDMRRHLKLILAEEQVRRMTRWEVLQHSMLVVTFVLLVITGFALRFPDSWWAGWLFGREGGFPFRNLVHRISGVALILLALMHLSYLRGARGRAFMKGVLPSFEDVRHFVQMMRYNLGWAEEKPRFGAFSFGEKFEYWALVWGVMLMGVTGTMLWFDNFFVQFLPKGVLDVVLVIHYYEAWLATLAIAIWHLYSTIFKPEIYPMNPSWLTGKMPASQYRHEHPAENVEVPMYE